LSECHKANQRLTPRLPHSLARLVCVHPAATAAVILAPILVTLASPASEQRRPHSLNEHHSSAPRRLAALLRPHNHRPPIVERRQEAARVSNSARIHPVMVRRAVELPAVERQRLALEHATRNLAVTLNPLSSQKTN